MTKFNNHHKRFKSIVAAAVIATLGFGVAPAQASQPVQVDSSASVSAEASVQFLFVLKRTPLLDQKNGTKVLNTVPAGTQITVHSNSGGWVNATYGSKRGYIKSDVTAKTMPIVNNANYTAYTKKRVPLRDYPSANAPVVRSEPTGTQVVVALTRGDWVRVDDGGKVGWVVLNDDLTKKKSERTVSGTWYAKKDIPLRKFSNYGAQVATIPGGTKAYTKAYAGDWVKVQSMGKTGYVMGNLQDLSRSVTTQNVTDYTRYASHDSIVRKTPTTSPYDPSFKRIKSGEKVTVTAKVPGARGWVQVKYGSYVGYMIERDDLTSKAPPVDKNISDYGTFTTANLNMRKGPGTNYATAGSIKKGDKVTVTHNTTVSGWVKVKYGSKVGYVSSKYLNKTGKYSVAVYGTLRTGQSAYYVMGNFQQKIMNQRIAKSSLYQLWNRNWTFLTNGSGTVVAEQFQYGDHNGASMMKKLDIYEGQLKYQGENMYSRQRVTMSDGSISWGYKTTKTGERVAKASGNLISSGDFLKRS